MAKNSPQDLENRQYFSSKLNQFMKQKGVRQIDLHNNLGIPKSTITGYVKGTSLPTPGNVQKLADYFGVKKSDLDSRFFMDHDAIIKGPPTDPLLTAISDNTIQLTTDNKKRVLEYSNSILEEQLNQTTVEEPQPLYDVRAVSRLAAGFGYGYDDHDTKTVYVEDEPPRHDVASLVEGDSMTPDYEHGNVVYLVDRGFSRFSGQVCAVVVDDETFIKKVYTEPNGLRLVSINPAYPDRFIDFPPSGDTHIKIFSVVGSAQVVEN